MCLILFAYRAHPHYRLILAANRDEFYQRPTAPLDFWPDHPEVLAGRDLEQGGTWLGVTRNGRLAAITNYRDPRSLKSNAPSRGQLVSGFLLGSAAPEEYLRQVQTTAHQYNGFNLLLGDNQDLLYYSNHGSAMERVTPGIHGLSNHLLDTPWPKVARGKTQFAALVERSPDLLEEELFHLLQNQFVAPDEQLPETGVDLAWERLLSPIFITSPGYGTRCSSVLMIDLKGSIRLSERTWKPGVYPPECVHTHSLTLE
ncbi:MAG: NRDE family protein [Desulfobacteraceae bacterium]|nr:NRDE family protein [Desulfobacteraceae bacterium]